MRCKPEGERDNGQRWRVGTQVREDRAAHDVQIGEPKHSEIPVTYTLVGGVCHGRRSGRVVAQAGVGRRDLGHVLGTHRLADLERDLAHPLRCRAVSIRERHGDLGDR